MRKQVVLSLSGGMDSSSLLLKYLADDFEVTALTFDYGQKHRLEIERAFSLSRYLNEKLGQCIKHQPIILVGLSALLNSTLVEGNAAVPEGHYEQDNMKETVVPNRNKIFASITQAVALSIAKTYNDKVIVALGIHAGDHAVYPDCRQEFRDADYRAFQLGNWDAERVIMETPYLQINKYDILQSAEMDCSALGVDFDEVFKRTNTSYKPIKHGDTWYSDYKSAASVERIEAFIKLGRPDPVAYANEVGPVTWYYAREHVVEVLAQHAYGNECK